MSEFHVALPFALKNPLFSDYDHPIESRSIRLTGGLFIRHLTCLLTMLIWGNTTFATSAYYAALSWKNSSELKASLFQILDGTHLSSASGDQIVEKCTGKSKCFKHQSLSYNMARKNLFGDIHLNGNSPGTYHLFTYYCPDKITNKDFGPNKNLAPMEIPAPSVLNTEHAWPQSKFSKKFPDAQQKGDLHILYPVHSNVNSIRSNHPYGVVAEATSTPCPEASLGRSAEKETVFEPDHHDKGDVARALFYFSVRYKMPIDKNQERYLRSWHAADPVDQDEVARNEKVFSLQKDRNPFIDMPELVAEITDF